MARIKTDQERGPIGTWLKRERLSRDWSPERVVEALRDVTGTVIRVDYYRQVEARTAGKLPGPDLLRDFRQLYGSEPTALPEPERPGPSPDTLAIVAAIDRLAAAIQAQKDEAPVWAQAVVSAVLAGRQLLPADAARDAR